MLADEEEIQADEIREEDDEDAMPWIAQKWTTKKATKIEDKVDDIADELESKSRIRCTMSEEDSDDEEEAELDAEEMDLDVEYDLDEEVVEEDEVVEEATSTNAVAAQKGGEADSNESRIQKDQENIRGKAQVRKSKRWSRR